MNNNVVLTDLLDPLLATCKEAGKKIKAISESKTPFAIKSKQDNSPVTEADWQAHTHIEEALNRLTPHIPQLSEESRQIPYTTRSLWNEYWLIDPLDGTKEFIAGTAEYTINIALIRHGVPIMGVIHAPVLEESYAAIKGQGCYSYDSSSKVTRLITRPWVNQKPILLLSRRHHSVSMQQKLLEEIGEFDELSAGSSLKFCLLAAGKADAYPRLEPTSEWDTAAGQCILEEAGGAVLDLHGQPLRYNTKESLLNPSFIAVADATHDWHLLCEKIRTRM